MAQRAKNVNFVELVLPETEPWGGSVTFLVETVAALKTRMNALVSEPGLQGRWAEARASRTLREEDAWILQDLDWEGAFSHAVSVHLSSRGVGHCMPLRRLDSQKLMASVVW